MVVVVVVEDRHEISCTGEKMDRASLPSYFILKSDPGQLCQVMVRLFGASSLCLICVNKRSWKRAAMAPILVCLPKAKIGQRQRFMMSARDKQNSSKTI